jgi:Transglycosylase SLT domain
MKRALLAIGALLAAVSGYAQQHRHMDSRQEKSTISSERRSQHFGRHERRAAQPLVDTDRLAHVESSGRPKARNPRSGACGLYQLMPATFRKFRDRTKPNNCFNAEANRAAAFNYLNYLHAKHDGDREKVLREWHSGTTRGRMKPVTRRFVRMVLNENKRPEPERRIPSPLQLVSSSNLDGGW